MTMSFTGPQVEISYAKSRDGGTARIFVDGEGVGFVSFDGTSARPTFGYTRAYSGLGSGEYTVRLVMRKGAGYVDDFAIWGSLRR
jgi:hypothetical protein